MAKLVSVTGGYSVDATEVTRSQYAAWLATNPPTGDQPSHCTWNTSFLPTCEWPGGAKGNHPVVCVDWCDAHAYCQSVGKRLCGQIGGGPNPYDAYANPTSSQWYKACSSDGKHDFPYGDTYSTDSCNGKDVSKADSVPGGSLSGCKSSASGFGGIFDLSGNAMEWEDACDKVQGATDGCRIRGGGFDSTANLLRCSFGNITLRSTRLKDLGFRCCSS